MPGKLIQCNMHAAYLYPTLSMVNMSINVRQGMSTTNSKFTIAMIISVVKHKNGLTYLYAMQENAIGWATRTSWDEI